MKCEIPALESVSSREPAPIQKPRATERTLGMRSEITRSPESSSERTYFCTRSLSLAGSAGRPGHLMQRRDQLTVGLPQTVDNLVGGSVLAVAHRGDAAAVLQGTLERA